MAGLAALALSTSGASALVVEATYITGGTPANIFYSTAGNWFFDDPLINSLTIVPENGEPPLAGGGLSNTEYNVIFSDTNSLNVLTPDFMTLTLIRRIDNMTVGAGKTLTIVGGPGGTGRLELDAGSIRIPDVGDDDNPGGNLVNDGTIVLNGPPAVSSVFNEIRVRDGDLNISGTGVIEMTDSPQNRITTIGSAAIDKTLIQGADHTIRGAGIIGENNLRLNNSGTIEANQANNRIDLDLAGGLADNTNTGTIGASGDGELRLFATELDNTGGTIQALDNGAVVLRSIASAPQTQTTHIRGGTLHTEGNGVIRTDFNTSILEDLAIDLGSGFEVSNGSTARVLGTIENDGTFNIASTGGQTNLSLGSETVTFSGTGEILMTGDGTENGSQARIRRQTTGSAAPAQTTLINDTDHGIRGAGDVGLNTFFLDNRGTIDADGQGANLTLTVNTAGDQNDNTNTGTMQASSGGTLEILGTTINNAGGTIQALAGSTVELRAANSSGESAETRIVGGTLHSEGTGIIRGVSNNVVLQDVTIDGGSRYRFDNGTSTSVVGTITNDGTFEIGSTGNQTTLSLASEQVTFDGGGTLLLPGNGADNLSLARIRRQTSGGPSQSTLFNEASHTIRGAGDIGVNTFFLDNRGLIDADGQGNGLRLTIDLLGDENDNSNTGTMRASNGGILEITSTSLTNSSNTIEALDGSVVELNGNTRIVGGVLSSEGTGVIEVRSNNNVMRDVTLSAGSRIEIVNQARLIVENGITNDGTIQIDSVNTQTRLDIAGDATFGGAGNVVMAGPDARIRGSGTLTNDAAHTIEGAGELGRSNISLINRGRIAANTDGNLLIDAINGGQFVNEGVLEASGTGGMTIQQTGATFATSGQVNIADGSFVNVIGTFTQTGGTTTLNGPESTLSASGSIDIEGGLLQGTGTIDGDLNVSGGGAVGPGLSPGDLTVDGDVSFGAASRFVVEIFSFFSFDRLLVSGDGELAGTLEIDLGGGPFGVGDEFRIMEFGTDGTGTRTGEFDLLAGIGASFFDIFYEDTGVTLIATQARSPVTGVSEPGAIALFCIGLVGIAFVRRRVAT